MQINQTLQMTNLRTSVSDILTDVQRAELSGIRNFLLSNPEKPIIATGSGAAETAADFAALLCGARGAVATAVTPYTLNSYSDEALKASKLLLVSAGGHNNDIVFAARRGLSVNPQNTASFTFSQSDRNEVRKLFRKAGADKSFDITGIPARDGFVSVGTPIAYFAILSRIFNPSCDLEKFSEVPEVSFRIETNEGTALSAEDLRGVSNFVILHGSWGRPVAWNLEGKLVESGLAGASVYDFRNFCHGRFIYTSNHLEDSAVILFISPRERDIAGRVRGFLPASTKLVIIETEEDAPEASLDLLIRSTEFFFELCEATGTNLESPSNPGKIDKRVPIWIPFTAGMKKSGPLTLSSI